MDKYQLNTATWTKSSYSDDNGGDCVEVATWIKSSHSGEDGGNCIEIAPDIPAVVPVRDSKNPDGPILVINRPAWLSFIAAVRSES
ncbi:DUF397 domain-containing protein [Streptomyces sp. 11x1]|uniref:DUF397 domain-containing protein n=1 Tax=Streptomyces sp. 11x1 TaxID=3038642 RepID=UPI0029301991|nr:DUF397 domain-containing protein [Streptomyces sp. 11x1]WNZ09392.1 DUF397 domain-containing protein [Streptomyces sp. 11x1]